MNLQKLAKDLIVPVAAVTTLTACTGPALQRAAGGFDQSIGQILQSGQNIRNRAAYAFTKTHENSGLSYDQETGNLVASSKGLKVCEEAKQTSENLNNLYTERQQIVAANNTASRLVMDRRIDVAVFSLKRELAECVGNMAAAQDACKISAANQLVSKHSGQPVEVSACIPEWGQTHLETWKKANAGAYDPGALDAKANSQAPETGGPPAVRQRFQTPVPTR
jgi:hypothetical protein